MLTVPGGVTADWPIVWPLTLSGWLLLFCYGIVFAVLLYRSREPLAVLSWKRWLILLLLSLGGFFLSRLQPPLPVPTFVMAYGPAPLVSGGVISVALLAAVPYLLAGAILGAAPALLVGFFTGLGFALGSSGQVAGPFIYAFAAFLAAWLMSLWHPGRFYKFLRLPIIAGLAGQASTAVFAALVALANAPGLLAALDAALAAFQRQLWPALLAGLVSGTIVTFMVRAMAQWLPSRTLRPSPMQRSVRTFLKANVVFVGLLFWVIAAAVVFIIATTLASRLLVTEMAASSNQAAAELDGLRAELEQVLSQSSADEDFTRLDKGSAARGLGRTYRRAEHFHEVMLIDQDQQVVESFPAQETLPRLAEGEREAVNRALREGRSAQTVADLPGEGRVISLIVPVQEREGQLPAALIARMPTTELVETIAPLSMEKGTSRVIDDSAEVLAATGPFSTVDWMNPEAGGAETLYVPPYLGGSAYLMDNERQSRDVHYLTPPNGRSWRVAAVVPYETVLNSAFETALPVMLVLLAATVILYARFASYGQGLAGPISELARASRTIAAGGSLTTPVEINRHDEVGELGRAFTDMQKAIKGRMDELSLLLEISQTISTSIDIYQSMPVLLQGAVRGTSGAVGARAAILNPRGRAPLTFAQGPAGNAMDIFDRTLMVSMRGKNELAHTSPRGLGQLLGLRAEDMPVKALFAVPLKLNNRFQGVFYVGYSQAREFNKGERDLLHTLAGQAAVLVENAHLFARAESGRQRLQAVLASTTDPIIVTDQTSRIFMCNKAVEEAFGISSDKARGRLVADLITSDALVSSLTDNEMGERRLEIRGKDERTYLANISPIVSRSGRLMGRVALLHDVTRFKEADSLKSEFVSNVSHDLKTPLTIISQSASELGMDEGLSPEQKSLTENILAAVERIVNFVDTMLDIERLEAGRELIYETFAVSELLQELAVDQWYYIENSGLTMRTRVDPQLPPVTADRAALYQTVENLISNATKYAPQSGELLLAASQHGEQVVISLRDRGPGIAERDQMRLFEKGYRVKRHGSGSAKGSGMGLAYVKTAAERHGGRAWCESELGKGSTFFVSIPFQPDGR